MKKKKIISIILLIILTLIIIFISFTIRKMIIINDLSKKVESYVNSNNFYEKIANNMGTTTEFYRKGNNTVMFMNSTLETGEKRTFVTYTKGEKNNSYIDTGIEKVALLDSEGETLKINIIGIKSYYNNLWDLFRVAVSSSIKNGEHNGKQCYILSIGKPGEAYVEYREKETGLMLKSIQGAMVDKNGNETDMIVEYYYEFDNVDDSIFIEPDISQYRIQENN